MHQSFYNLKQPKGGEVKIKASSFDGKTFRLKKQRNKNHL